MSEARVIAPLWYKEEDWTVRFRKDAPIEAYEAFIGKGIEEVAQRHFKIGDAYNQLVENHPDDLYQLFDRVDYEEGTIRNDGYIAKRFPVSKRGRPGVYWSHYQELAAIKDPKERDDLLDRCTDHGDGSERMSINEVKEYKKEWEGGVSGDFVEGNCPCCHGEGSIPADMVAHVRKHLEAAGLDLAPF